MPISPKHPYVGVAAIIIRDGLVLLGKRKNAHAEGDWAFPGGHLEFGESWENCIKREIKEETGLEALKIGLAIPTNDIFIKDNLHYVTLFFEVQCKPAEPRVREPEKCIEWRWFSWNNLPDNIMLPIKNLIAAGYQPPST